MIFVELKKCEPFANYYKMLIYDLRSVCTIVKFTKCFHNNWYAYSMLDKYNISINWLYRHSLVIYNQFANLVSILNCESMFSFFRIQMPNKRAFSFFVRSIDLIKIYIFVLQVVQKSETEKKKKNEM